MHYSSVMIVSDEKTHHRKNKKGKNYIVTRTIKPLCKMLSRSFPIMKVSVRREKRGDTTLIVKQDCRPGRNKSNNKTL